MQTQAIFKKVAFSEKKLILREVAVDKTQLSIKGAMREDMFHLIAMQNERDEVLLCRHTADSEGIKPKKVIVNFSFKSERYFFKAELYFESGWVALKIKADLFQLQRRANARIDIPDSYSAVLILSQYAGRSYFLDCKIMNISAGGCKIELPADKPELKLGESLKGSLRLGNRRSMELEFAIRFVQKQEQNGATLQIAGMQYLNVDQNLENRLLILMMDLQRELFLKYPKHK